MKWLTRTLKATALLCMVAILTITANPAMIHAQQIYGNTFPYWNVNGPLYVTGKTTLIGTSNGDDALTSVIGEFNTASINTSVSGVSLATTVPAEIVSMTLTAGDWKVYGMCNNSISGVTATVYSCSLSNTVSAVGSYVPVSGIGYGAVKNQAATFGTTLTGKYDQDIGPVRVTTSVPLTLNLVAANTFSAGTISAVGSISARRMR